MKKSKAKENIECEELKSQISTMEESYRKLHQEKENLTKKFLLLQNKYQQLVTNTEKDVAVKTNEKAEKLKV